jgi:PPK2 family polyphosphate:nucleotide phosphotransferase
MKKIAEEFRVRPGEAIDLKRRPTRVDPVYGSTREYKQLLDEDVALLSAQQELLYASNRYALLIIFQAMDAAGKDGCIKHVMSGVNPQGCDVFSYSHPSSTDQRHDFLWRTTCDLPERGKIAIFNRSYYEEVLIVRVHPEILRAEAVPDNGKDENIWQSRYRSIVDLERHLHANGTRIVKIFLHVSREEQRRRLLDRIDTEDKNWKLKPSDIAERRSWSQYRAAYEDCMSATSTRKAPWYIVPADDKFTARLFVSHLILGMLADLALSFPATTPQRKKELQAMRKQLEAD